MACMHGMDGRFCAVCNNALLKREPFFGRPQDPPKGQSVSPNLEPPNMRDASVACARGRFCKVQGQTTQGFKAFGRTFTSAWREASLSGTQMPPRS